MKNGLIILSGGMDSITMLYDYQDCIKVAVSFDYGSNHNMREIPFAKMHCRRLRIKHYTIHLGFIHKYFKSSLLEGASAVPDGNYDDDNMKSTVVPFRNGIMLSVAAEEINEALFDNFGDTVIAFDGDTPIIIEDYENELKGMFNI